MASFASLPSEIVLQVVAHLPIPSLLAVSQTSRYHHRLAHSSLQTLRLSIQPTRLSALAALLSSSRSPGVLPLTDSSNPASRSPFLQQPAVSSDIYINARLSSAPLCDFGDRSGATIVHIVPQSHASSLQGTLYYQNTLASTLVTRYVDSLRSLALDIWDLDSRSAFALAILLRRPAQLKQLVLCFDNTILRGCGAGMLFWKGARRNSRGTHDRHEERSWATWDVICEACETTGEGSLERLELVRPEVKGSQLAKLVQSHPHLKELRLKKCRNIGWDFWQTLVPYPRTKSVLGLETFAFVESLHPEVDNRIIDVVQNMPHLRSLSLQGCHNINDELLEQMNNDYWHIPELILPGPKEPEQQGPIVVDPDYR